jgi:hypothetical protein
MPPPTLPGPTEPFLVNNIIYVRLFHVRVFSFLLSNKTRKDGGKRNIHKVQYMSKAREA